MDEVKFTKWIAENPILRARKKHGYTRNEVAVACGVGNGSVKNWEAGTQEPGGDNVVALSKILEIDLTKELEKWTERKPRL